MLVRQKCGTDEARARGRTGERVLGSVHLFDRVGPMLDCGESPCHRLATRATSPAAPPPARLHRSRSDDAVLKSEAAATQAIPCLA